MTNEQKTLFYAVIALKFSQIVFPSIRLPLAYTHHTKLGQFCSARKKDGKESFTFINYCSFPFNSTESERINTSIVVHLGFPISVHKFTQICRTFFFQRAWLSFSRPPRWKKKKTWLCVCWCVHGENNGGAFDSFVTVALCLREWALCLPFSSLSLAERGWLCSKASKNLT